MKSHELLGELCKALHDEGHSLDRCGDFEAWALTHIGKMEQWRRRDLTDRQAHELLPKGPSVALVEIGGSRSGLYKKAKRHRAASTVAMSA